MDLFSAIYSYSFDGFFQNYISCYLSYWLHLLLIVCGGIKLNPGPGFGRLFSYICGIHDNLNELALAKLDFDVLASAESKVSHHRHLLELCTPGFGCPQQRLKN